MSVTAPKVLAAAERRYPDGIPAPVRAAIARDPEGFIHNLARRKIETDSIDLAWHRMHAKAIIDLARPPTFAGRVRELVRYAIFGERIDLAPSTMERKQAEKRGAAMQGGRFPIRNGDDLDKAIHAVGRARPNTEEERAKVRRFIVKRAKALGLQSRIPDGWRADGSLG